MISCIGGPMDGREVDETEHTGQWFMIDGDNSGRYERVGMELIWRQAPERPLQPLDRRRWAAVQEDGAVLPSLNLPAMRLKQGEVLWVRYPGMEPGNFRVTLGRFLVPPAEQCLMLLRHRHFPILTLIASRPRLEDQLREGDARWQHRIT